MMPARNRLISLYALHAAVDMLCGLALLGFLFPHLAFLANWGFPGLAIDLPTIVIFMLQSQLMRLYSLYFMEYIKTHTHG
mgnify:FL=1